MSHDLHDLIAEYQSGDPDQTAAAVFDAVKLPSKWRDLFYAVVRDECRRTARHHVRGLEANPSHNGIVDQGSSAGVASIAPKDQRDGFLSQRFYTGTEYVTWGAATVEDHRERIAYLATLRNGIDATIARHADAVEQIESAGASCLNDIEAVAA